MTFKSDFFQIFSDLKPGTDHFSVLTKLRTNAFEFDVRVRKVRGFCSSSKVDKCSSSKFDFFEKFELFYRILGIKNDQILF